jgi:RNA polymerase sigma-70 factor (ECF subfamily)
MADEYSDVIERARHGDSPAYAEVVRLHRRSLYRLAWSVLGSEDEAEDCVQEAFIKAYEAIRRRGAPPHLTAWLRRITVNCAISQLRRCSVRTAFALGEGAPEADGAALQAQAEAAELQRRICLAARSLPPRQRVAFGLVHIHGLSQPETAEAMGCSLGSVKVHLHRARERLALELRDWLGEDQQTQCQDRREHTR